MLYGVSVFALLPGRGVAGVLERFPNAPHYLALTVGQLRVAGFEVFPTGSNPEHFDVQLISGIPADGPYPPVDDAAARSEVAGVDPPGRAPET